MAQRTRARTCITMLAASLALAASAGEFSVTPIRAELKPGQMSETITVINHAAQRLRVNIKLMEWTQDASGKDIYKESSDLIYFPRQMDLEPDAKRLVRVGAKVPAGVTERAYRLYVEEEPDLPAAGGRPQVALRFRFGVPVFLPPPAAKPVPEVMEPQLAAGKLSIAVKNAGNAHFRLNKVSVTDGATFSQEVAGWYSLAGTERSYSVDIPREVCRKGGTLSVILEGEGLRFDRKLNVDPARCA